MLSKEILRAKLPVLLNYTFVLNLTCFYDSLPLDETLAVVRELIHEEA